MVQRAFAEFELHLFYFILCCFLDIVPCVVVDVLLIMSFDIVGRGSCVRVCVDGGNTIGDPLQGNRS